MKWLGIFLGSLLTILAAKDVLSPGNPHTGPGARAEAGCHSGRCYYYKYRYRYDYYGRRYRYRYKVYYDCPQKEILVGVPVQVPVYSIGYQNYQYPPPPVQVTDPQRYLLPGQPGQPLMVPDCAGKIKELE